jgi:hypothetical protein
MTTVINKSDNAEENLRVENIIPNADGKEIGVKPLKAI